MRTRQSAAVGLALILVSGACGGGDPAPTTAETTPPPTTAATSQFVELEAEIDRHMTQGGIPSLAAAMVAGDEVIWVGGFGEQAAADTIYMVGSIAKPFEATAVLQLLERGLIDLDNDVGDYLPFPVRHPDYPDTPITIEMLLTHTSGMAHDLPAALWWDNDPMMLEWMRDNLDVDISEYPFTEGRPPVTDYLEYFLAPGAEEGADAWAADPGTPLTYSNTAYTLILRHIIAEASGQPFPEYMEEHIFAPLGMTSTGYDAAEFAEHRLAIPYTRFADGDRPLPRVGQSATGPLRATATDLARFLAAHMRNGEGILTADSAAMMHERHVVLSGTDAFHDELRGNGLGWFHWGDGQSGHGGGTPGFLSEIVMQERDEGTVGMVLMMNLGCSFRCDHDVPTAQFIPIRELLLDTAAAASAG